MSDGDNRVPPSVRPRTSIKLVPPEQVSRVERNSDSNIAVSKNDTVFDGKETNEAAVQLMLTDPSDQGTSPILESKKEIEHTSELMKRLFDKFLINLSWKFLQLLNRRV